MEMMMMMMAAMVAMISFGVAHATQPVLLLLLLFTLSSNMHCSKNLSSFLLKFKSIDVCRKQLATFMYTFPPPCYTFKGSPT